jgi:hypothetical protein
MSELDTLTQEFDRLLESIPRGKYSLEEWRYAYRKVVYSGAKKILNDFPELIVGPKPQPMQSEKGPGAHPVAGGLAGGQGVLHPVADGQPPPYRPNAINQVLCIILGTCPQHNT